VDVLRRGRMLGGTYCPAKALQVHCELHRHAEIRGRVAHGEFLLLGQCDGRVLYGQVGEQDPVLHRVGVWSRDLGQ